MITKKSMTALIVTSCCALSACGDSSEKEAGSLHDLKNPPGVSVDYDPTNTPEAVSSRAKGAAVVRLLDVEPGHVQETDGGQPFEFVSIAAEIVDPLHGSGTAGETIHLEMMLPNGGNLEDVKASLPEGDVVAIWGDHDAEGLALAEGAQVDDPPKFLFVDGLVYEDPESGDLENPMVAASEPGSPWPGAKTVDEVAQDIRDNA